MTHLCKALSMEPHDASNLASRLPSDGTSHGIQLEAERIRLGPQTEAPLKTGLAQDISEESEKRESWTIPQSCISLAFAMVGGSLQDGQHSAILKK